MFVTVNPDPPYKGQTGYLRIELEHEQPDTYWLRIVPRNYGTPVAHFADGDGNPIDKIEWELDAAQDFEPQITFDAAGALRVQWSDTDPGRQWPPPTEADSIEVADVLDYGPVDATVALAPTPPPTSQDEVLWRVIGAISRRLRFDEFRDAIQPYLPNDNTSWYGSDAYTKLKRLADDFVTRAAAPLSKPDSELPKSVIESALKRSYVSSIDPPSEPFLSYEYGTEYEGDCCDKLERQLVQDGVLVRPAAPAAAPKLQFPLPNVPFVELIWNYWTEEGMLVQTLNHVVARFQNRRPGPGIDPLARFDLNPLMPLRTLLWNFAEDEQNRLTVRRRAAEYEYEYGLTLLGRAIPGRSTLVDRRSQFLESFHRLLNACIRFYKERDDKTVDADAFPLLSNLREVHLVLARGAHNQFANLAVTARAEMLTMQWMLAQPEMHEFLGGPTMVPYEEPWMDRVDSMKSIQGWSATSITHFFDLAVQGEQILLSVRHGRWNESVRKREDAANWALLWRNEIQRYVHAYAAVTGIDLNVVVDATMPSALIARRLMEQRRRA